MLSDKLVNIDNNIEEDKVLKQDGVRKRVAQFHDKIDQNAAAQQIQLKILKERTEKLYEDVEEERRVRQGMDNEMERYASIAVYNLYIHLITLTDHL